MEEFGQGGMSRSATTDSASRRSSGSSRATRSSPRTVMRERMRSRASSTGITPPFYPGGAPGSGSAALIEAGAVALQEAIAAEDEQREEAAGDEELGEADGESVHLRHRREDEEAALEEHPRPAHEEDHHQGLVGGRRAAGEALEQIAEGDEPARDEDHERHGPPRILEEAAQEEARLHRHVPVPDHQVLGEEEVDPHHAHREGELGHVLDGGRRHSGEPPRIGADGEEGDEAETDVERADHVVAAEAAAVPGGIERHHEGEAPEGQHDHEEDQEEAGELVAARGGGGG